MALVKPAERIAFRDRIARAIAWAELSEERRKRLNERADAIATELETSYDQHSRIGFVFVEGEEDEL